MDAPRPEPAALKKSRVLDLDFIEARSHLLEVAAFLDRLDRASGTADYRLEALRRAVSLLGKEGAGRTRAILEALSDPTVEPVPQAPGKGASGAWPVSDGKPTESQA